MLKRLLLLSIALFVVFASGCTINLNNNSTSADQNEQSAEQNGQKLDAQSVLNKSMAEMGKLKGYKWQMTENQDLATSKSGVNAKTKVNAQLDYISKTLFHANLELEAQVGDLNRNNTSLELYAKDQMLYAKDGYSNKWVKTNMASDLTKNTLGLYQEYPNPKYTLEKVLNEVKDAKMTEQSDAYVIELTLNDSNRIRPFMKYALENWENDPQVVKDQITFNSFKITLQIDKKTFQLNKIEENLRVGIPLTFGETVNIDQNTVWDFKGEVSDITIPTEVESAQEVTPGSGNTNGAYRPGDIFKGININPNFGSSKSSQNKNTNDSPIVDPSFGSY
jgi:hypothetical protein